MENGFGAAGRRWFEPADLTTLFTMRCLQNERPLGGTPGDRSFIESTVKSPRKEFRYIEQRACLVSRRLNALPPSSAGGAFYFSRPPVSTARPLNSAPRRCSKIPARFSTKRLDMFLIWATLQGADSPCSILGIQVNFEH